MKMLRFRVAAMLLFGLFSTYASSGAPKVPPQEGPKTPTSKAAAAAQEQVSPEENRKRKDWNDGMLRKPAPRNGPSGSRFRVEKEKSSPQFRVTASDPPWSGTITTSRRKRPRARSL
jgi:hypothetical protein